MPGQVTTSAAHPFEVGKSYRLYFFAGNPNNCVLHIRAIVDDEYVVTRRWSRRWGGSWFYDIKGLDLLRSYHARGNLKERK